MSYINKLNDNGPLICKVCGAPINTETMQCDYCGTSYSRQAKPNSGGLGVLRAPGDNFDTIVETIDDVDMKMLKIEFGVDEAYEIVKKEIANRIAERLLPYIDFKESYSIKNFKSSISGCIRVVPGAGHGMELFATVN